MRHFAFTFLVCLVCPLAVTHGEPKGGKKHWSYRPVMRPRLPVVGSKVEHPIDRFVVARLSRERLQLSRQAARSVLLRRVYLDLTGLPPSLSAIDAFLADQRPDAYERIVDRLLASPHYGEHWGRYWLDVARFADTNGYNIDVGRPIWPYRDWVIQALNSNMPFDRFTIEQIAGDLLPRSTVGQRVATGFHRNTMVNQEGGVDPEEDRVKAVVDRVSTTATVWLGTTLACSQCHNHFYDPFTQRDFFRLYAFFNNTKDKAATSDLNPIIQLPTSQQKMKLAKIRAAIQQLTKSQTKRKKSLAADEARLLKGISKSLVMQRRQKLRGTRVHIRGDFLDAGEKVTPGTPPVLHPLTIRRGQSQGRFNRLDLARWLVDKNNPLVGRVTMNRHWQRLFGTGLVATSDDFGKRGAKPTHPELLDWLAAEFVESGWNVKRMHRLIVTSATYRQTSTVPAKARSADAATRLRSLLAIGPRFRLDAESIRDIALAASGRLNLQIGGRSVYPNQPKGFWLEFGVRGFGMEKWPTSPAADRWRRGVYTFWRRTSAYPTFTILDAPSREHCTVRRPRSNTPLQALATMNDPAFVACSVGLAARTMQSGGATLSQRMTFAFRLCVARRPKPVELNRLRLLYYQQLKSFQGDVERAKQLIGRHTTRAADLPALAAWTIVASVLLNLDETLTKG